MIKKIKSKLSVKVFFITSLLMASCCLVTYLCIARFAPYVYLYELSDAQEIADMLSLELSHAQFNEAGYIMDIYNEILSKQYDDEFIFHVFKNTGEEMTLPYLNELTGTDIRDYEKVEKTEEYSISFVDSTDVYCLFLAKNTGKESQVIEAIQKSFPVLCVIIIAVSVIAAFFYTWYITKPIKRVSTLSEQMASLNFNVVYKEKRTDEIGVLSRSLSDLSEKLVKALSELQEANEKLQADINMERRMERQRVEFFSAASHELKTPITIIKGQLQGMLYNIGRYKDRETYLKQSLKVTDTLEKMVQELLTISRLDTPGYVCNKCKIDFSMLIKERIISYEDLFMQKKLTVEQSIFPETYVYGDAGLLQKMLDNLLGNAAAYSGEGEHVFLKLWKEGEKVNFSIENTGVHIPEEDISKLFEAFYRVEQSRNRQTGGSGLGLYIVKKIIDLHGAKIEITNTLEGVMVEIYF